MKAAVNTRNESPGALGMRGISKPEGRRDLGQGACIAPLTAPAVLGNAVGRHAPPSVKLTQCAKRFAAKIELALAPDGPWTDANSPVKLMRVKASQGATLHFRVGGPDGKAALAAVLALVHDGFGEA